MRSLRSLFPIPLVSFALLSHAGEHATTNSVNDGSFPAAASRVKLCKAMPGTTEWPSLADWAALNDTVHGRLLKPDPPAAVCHKDHPAYDMGACLSLELGWWFSGWHSQHPTSGMWQNYNNYTCSVDSTAPCTNDGYPVYVVKAIEAGDVKAAVDFARTRNIRLNIKSTGHDFLGR
jgi:hypothetical protein